MRLREDEKDILRAIVSGKKIERPILPSRAWQEGDEIRWVDCNPREALTILSMHGVCRVKPE